MTPGIRAGIVVNTLRSFNAYLLSVSPGSQRDRDRQKLPPPEDGAVEETGREQNKKAGSGRGGRGAAGQGGLQFSIRWSEKVPSRWRHWSRDVREARERATRLPRERACSAGRQQEQRPWGLGWARHLTWTL